MMSVQPRPVEPMRGPALIADYAQARAEFVAKKDEALKKVDEIKKDLGTKWEELTGKKS